MSKFYLCLTEEEKKLVVKSLFSEKNDLIQQGKYTDGVDDILLKILQSRQKNFYVKYI